MRRLAEWAVLAIGLLVAVPAWADSDSCADFRKKIADMENGSVRPPGWFQFDLYLRDLYKADCIDHPTLKPAPEFWFRADGTNTGVPVGQPGQVKPADGAYATTAEIGAYCLAQAGPMIPAERGGGQIRARLSPSICALMLGQVQACAQPVDDQERNQCKTVLADAKMTASLPPSSQELPPMRVGLDGGPYNLTPNCSALLSRLSGDASLDQASADEKAGWLSTLRGECPDLLAAMERRTGASPDRDPTKFWPALAGLILNGFAPPGAPQRSAGDINADPGFQRMCREARVNQQTCLDRFAKIASYGTNPGSVDPGTPSDSQRGAFADCVRLYGSVLEMCRATTSLAARNAARLLPASKPAAAPPQPPKASGGDSRPPPQQRQMSAQCQQLVSSYVAAAQANDGPRALAGYNALKAAGGCDVLAKVDRPMPQTSGAPSVNDPRFVARGATPLSDQVVGSCDASPAECQRRVEQLRAGAGPAAQAAMIANAIGIGLQLGGMMANGMMMAAPPQVGGTNMNSIGNRPVSSTYGQGAPTYRPAPPQRPSDITGTK